MKHRRGSPVRVVVARAKYKTAPEPGPGADEGADDRDRDRGDAQGAVPRARAARVPSMIAHPMVHKYRWGLPFHRQARMMAADGFAVDDGTGCAVTPSTSAPRSGVYRRRDGQGERERRPSACRPMPPACAFSPSLLASGRLAARVTFSWYSPTRTTSSSKFTGQATTSAAVCEMFRGFRGYIQADAHAVLTTRSSPRRGADPLRRRASQGGRLLEPLPPAQRGRRRSWQKTPPRAEALLRMRKLFGARGGGGSTWLPRSVTRAGSSRLAHARG